MALACESPRATKGAAVDERTMDAFVAHMAITAGSKFNQRTKQTVATANLFPAFADYVRAVCKKPINHRDRRYDGIARELPAIARSMGIATFENDRIDDGRDPEAIIENALKYMSQETESGLVKPFLAWAWKKDESGLTQFMASAEFINPADQPPQTATPIFRPAGEQADSLYDLKNVFALAEQRVILIAQNHWHMASSRDTYWPLIEEALLRGVTVELVAMHSDVGPEGGFLNRVEEADQTQLPAHAVNMWTSYLRWPKFIPQLDEMWNVFRDWRNTYDDIVASGPRRLGKFRTYGSYFQPNTITAIDPDMRRSIVIVSPRTSNSDSVGRPQFLIEKARDPAAFTFFWRYIDYGLSNDMWPLVTE